MNGRENRIYLWLLSTVVVAFFGACASTTEEIPEDLNPAEYFQLAQNVVSDEGNYALAIRYYQSFIDSYPEDLQRVVIAKYEIAFLNYKQGKKDLARSQFEELLSYYDEEGASVLPRWPQVLTAKILNRIDDESLNGEE
ncbi:MAG TPA: tetratricopeptide repeat protein [Sediminispirochaeta sp.]|nr:tetratricopeptide repeat protein [Sediminispirochaeta sp.]